MLLINSYRFGTTGPTDPNFSNVSLLLHGDGTNGSTTIIDSSPSPKTLTVSGNAQISTAQSRFGGASLFFDGSGDFITISNSETLSDFDFHAGDFTAEAWVFPRVNSGVICIAAKRPATSATGWLFSDIDFSGFIDGAWRQSVITAPRPTLNQWTHVALIRSGNDFRLFHNGTQVGNTYTQSGILQNLVTQPVRIGMVGGTTEIPTNGYIDELRITKGVARYTASFTPPTAPFPDA